MSKSAEPAVVIVDMDGTLLDLHFDDQVWNHALPRRLAEHTGMAPQLARQHVANTIAEEQGNLRWYCLDHWSEVFSISLHEVEREQSGLIRMRPGTADFLSHLAALGIPCILATNAHPRSLQLKLERTAMAPFFSAMRSSHEYGLPKEQGGFWDSLQQEFGFDPMRTLFVDDNLAVLRAARDWGIADLYGVTKPSSSGALREFPEFPSVNQLDELKPLWAGSVRA